MENKVKAALCRIAKSPNGGHDAMAAMLNISKVSLENRLYEAKGQAISIEQALLMQRLTERTDFAEAIAEESGGVFVKLPEIDERAIIGLDIQETFLDVFVKASKMFEEWREMTNDGKLTNWESDLLWRHATGLLQQVTGIAVITDRVFGVRHAEER